jgi:LmeA-like phospholipid-binding
MPQSSSESTSNPIPKRGLIRRVLEPALQLWLRSQAESVSGLQVHLEGGDRQILSGYLPQLQLQAEQVIYKGLHLSKIELSGHNLRINIAQVLKGKALKLLDALSIDLNVAIHAEDAQASLHSPLFQGAIIEALQVLVGEQIANALGQDIPSQDLMLDNPHLSLSENTLRFSTVLRTHQGDHCAPGVRSAPSVRAVPIALQTALLLSNPQTLELSHPEWLPTPQSKRGLPLHDLHGYTFDLGPQVQLQTLLITSTGIFVQGQMTILGENQQPSEA